MNQPITIISHARREAEYLDAFHHQIRAAMTAQLALWDAMTAMEQLCRTELDDIADDIKRACSTLDRTEDAIPDQAVADVMDAITRLLESPINDD